MKVIFLISLTLATSLAWAAGNCFVGGTKVLPGTTAYRNTEELTEFLDAAGQPGWAIFIKAKLERGGFYHHDTLDHWLHGNVLGCTHPLFGDISLRDDVMQAHVPTSINNPLSPNELRHAVDFLIVTLHEAIHVMDFNAGGLSSERPTYERSWQFMLDILKEHLVPRAQAGGADEGKYRRAIDTFTAALQLELMTYDYDEYGESRAFTAPLPHGGCVRELTRKELADYLLDLGGFIRREELSVADALKAFDTKARYRFPVAGNPLCLRREALLIPPPAADTTVGYAGARMRQRVYELAVTQGETIVLTKSSANLAGFNAAVVVPDASRPGHLRVIAETYASHPTGSGRSPVSEPFAKLIVHETAEGVFPADAVVRVERVWDEDGVRRRGPVPFREITVREIERDLGFYAVHTYDARLTLDDSSHHSFERHEDRVTGVYYAVKAGHRLRLSAPRFTGRSVRTYRITRPADPGQTLSLRPVSFMQMDEDRDEILFDEDGEYVTLAVRDDRYTERVDFDLRLEFSRHGGHPVATRMIDPRSLYQDDYRAMGSHRPVLTWVELKFRHGVSPVGFEFQSSLDDDQHPFKSLQVAKLTLKAQDAVRVQDMPTHYTASLVGWNPSKSKFEVEVEDMGRRGLHTVRTDGDRYLVFTHHKFAAPETVSSARVELVRRTVRGPQLDMVKPLSPEEVRAELGLSRATTFRPEQAYLTGAHPRGFTWGDSLFQMYSFTLDRKARLRLISAQEGIERTYWLMKVDPARRARGVPYLVDFRSLRRNTDFEVETEPAEFVLVVESDYGQPPGAVPFELWVSAHRLDQGRVNLRRLNTAEMTDPLRRRAQ